jgi:hypothetical protein
MKIPNWDYVKIQKELAQICLNMVKIDKPKKVQKGQSCHFYIVAFFYRNINWTM